MARCSICYTVLKESEPVTSCPDCRQDYHQTCWNEIGGCGTYGCQKAAVAQKPPVPVVVGQGWGDSKECPHCAKQIPSGWLACHCGAKFPWADPMTFQEFAAWNDRQASIKGTKTLLTWMFILSLAVFPAPVTGLIAGLVAGFRRKLLASDGTYLAMGYGSAALGGVFTLLIVLTSMGS
jgi:hypothetical protein